MLIIPLHKQPKFENFIFATLALVLINIVVYFFYQVPDDQRDQIAIDLYTRSELAQIELPIYQKWIERADRAELRTYLETIPAPDQQYVLLQQLNYDDLFLSALRHQGLMPTNHPDFAKWKGMRQLFDERRPPTFTNRFAMRYYEVNPLTAFTAMFLHGSGAHLIGNMVFLIVLGLVVEPVLGAALFLVLYILAGLGGQYFSLFYRWGEIGIGLGASGAIAGLMGAYAVLWGRRKVRFFYWFFVYFDYVKAPALWLLPVWFGWEVAQLLWIKDSNVAFDVHAAGILSGASLAFLVTKKNWAKLAFMQEDSNALNLLEEIQLGLRDLSNLDLVRARSRFDELHLLHPQDADIIEPRLRTYLYAKNAHESLQVFQHALDWRAKTRAETKRQINWWRQGLQTLDINQIETSTLNSMCLRWLLHSELDAVQTALQTLDEKTSVETDTLWLRVANAQLEKFDRASARIILSRLIDRNPNSTAGKKAALLLESIIN